MQAACLTAIGCSASQAQSKRGTRRLREFCGGLSCFVVPCRIELSGSPGDDGRARHCCVALDDSSVGESLCARVRKAIQPLRTGGKYFLACGRNLYTHSRHMGLSLSGCRQARQDGGFSASAGSRHCRCRGILSQSSINKLAEVAAQDHARWPPAEPHGPSASAARGSEVEVR